MSNSFLRKGSKAILCCTIVVLSLFLMGSFSYALEAVEEYVIASDGTKIPWGIREGYEKSDKTGKGLDPIMYYGHKPDVEKATDLEIQKAWWYEIRGQYCNYLYGFEGSKQGGFDVGALITKTNKAGITRDSATRRCVFTWPKLKGIDYKDTTMFLTPEDMRGIQTLIWHYIDMKKDYDQWLWVPALRKVRKLGAAEGEDSFGGMDIDYDDGFLRTPFQDSYKLIRIDVVDDKFIEQQRKDMADSKDIDKMTEYLKKEAYGHKMWVQESKPLFTRFSYAKRIVWVEQNTWREVRSDWFDEGGRRVKVMYRSWREYPFYDDPTKKHIFEDLIYAKNLLTGHHTEMNVTMKDMINNPKAENPEIFTVRYLMKSKW